MEALRRFFGLAPVPPKQLPIIQSDLVYPLHHFDNNPGMRKLLVGWMLQFNDVLDPEMLRSSLSRLLEIGDWKKLGGRLRLNVRISHHIEYLSLLFFIYHYSIDMSFLKDLRP